MTAISSHPESKPLMIKCIQCLDNIAMANQEHAALVIEVRIRAQPLRVLKSCVGYGGD